jgi:hypothetical protein
MFRLENVSPDSVADWIELTLIYEADDAEFISKAELSRVVEARGRTPNEAYISDIFEILNHRQRLYINSYFKIEGNSVQRIFQGESPVEYIFCLLLSLYGTERGGTKTKLFERLACCAINKYMKKAYVFGWPYDAVDDSDFNSRIEAATVQMADRLNERYNSSPEPHYKDAGIDVVAWEPFNDKRSGQLVLLVQCAAGHNRWNKVQIPIRRWNQYIHFAINPGTGFAFPKAMTSVCDWHDKSCDYGLLFDRIRIINLLSDGLYEQALKRDLNGFIRQELASRFE